MREHVEMARRFHDLYEQLAPQFGYATRPETRTFDPESPNGKLMTAVCAAMLAAAPTPAQSEPPAEGVEQDARRYRWLRENCKREWESDMPHDKGAPSLDIDFSAPGHDLDAAIDAAMAASLSREGWEDE